MFIRPLLPRDPISWLSRFNLSAELSPPRRCCEPRTAARMGCCHDPPHPPRARGGGSAVSAGDATGANPAAPPTAPHLRAHICPSPRRPGPAAGPSAWAWFWGWCAGALTPGPCGEGAFWSVRLAAAGVGRPSSRGGHGERRAEAGVEEEAAIRVRRLFSGLSL